MFQSFIGGTDFARRASERRLRALAAQGEGFDLVVPYQLDGLSGDGGMLRAVRVRRADGVDYVKEIAADILLPFFGLTLLRVLWPDGTWQSIKGASSASIRLPARPIFPAYLRSATLQITPGSSA